MRAPARITIVALISAVAALVTAELLLRRLYGLGDPVLYDSYPLYGYRLRPNQRVTRAGGAVIAVNNLGLRADRDWDAGPANKVLFLGDSVTYGGSYVSNAQLFSTLAVRGLPGVTSGNGAVNAWGVENIHGLVVAGAFLPAETVVTVLPEGDFYRGVTRIPGLPFWCRKPPGALGEAAFFFINRVNERRYRSWEQDRSRDKRPVVEAAAAKLAEMDRFLRAHGRRHLLYITPTRKQALGEGGKDSLVEAALRNRHLDVVYLSDRLKERRLTPEATRALFHDNVHLSIEGHRVWAEMIGADLARLSRPGGV